MQGRDDDAIEAFISQIEAWTTACKPEFLHRWRMSYLAWLKAVRRRRLFDVQAVGAGLSRMKSLGSRRGAM